MAGGMNDDSAADLARKEFGNAVRNYAPKLPRKFRELLPHREGIAELRRKGASYETIVDILHGIHISVCRDTLTRFCDEVLKLTPTPPRRRAVVHQPAPARPVAVSRRPAERHRDATGPRIANPDEV